MLLTRNALKDHETPAEQRRRGVTAMEYLMMLSLIIVVCMIGVSFLGSTNNNNMSSSSTAINKAMKKGG